MLETPQAIAKADAISAVKGVDVLLVGTNDLLMEIGLGGQFAHPEVGRAYERVVTACRKHGKWPGMGGVYSDDLLAKYIAMGMRMIITGNDLGLLMASASQRTNFLRNTPR
jgi:2-keto-3-deoxy-L-rhamnonate aldolase RhmA